MVDPYDVPDTTGLGIIGYDTQGNPVFASGNKTPSELAATIETVAPGRATPIPRYGASTGQYRLKGDTTSERLDSWRRQQLETYGFVTGRQLRQVREQLQRQESARQDYQRKQLEAYLENQARIARERQQAIQQQKERQEQLKLEQEAKARGITTQRLKELEESKFKQEEARESLYEKIPEAQRQRERFIEVFGEEKARKITSPTKQPILESRQSTNLQGSLQVGQSLEVDTEPTPNVISSFEPTSGFFGLPGERELGVNRPFFASLGQELVSRFRRFTNLQTSDDLEREVRGQVGGTIPSRIGEQQLIRYPSGTISTNEQPLTIKQFVELETVASGGTTPTQIVLQGEARKAGKEAQSKLDKEVKKIQERFDRGEITENEANTILSAKQKQIQEEAQIKFEKTQAKIIQKKQRGEALRTSLKETERIDVARGLTTGALIGTSIISPQVGGVAFATIGAREFITETGVATSGRDLTIKQRAIAGAKAAGGLSLVALGTAGAFGKIKADLTQLELERNIAGLESQQLKIAEVRFEGAKQGVSAIKGAKEFGTFKQEIDLVGRVFKDKGGRFIIPRGIGEARVTGILDVPISLQQKTISGIQRFEFGAKGLSFPLGSQEIFGTVAKTITIPTIRTGAVGDIIELKPGIGFPSGRLGLYDVTGRSAKSLIKQSSKGLSEQLIKNIRIGGDIQRQFVGGFSRMVKEDIFISRTGKISRFIFDTQKEKALIDINLKDIGVTKIFPLDKLRLRGTFDIVKGKGTGLPTATYTKIETKLITKPFAFLGQELSKEFTSIVPKIVTPVSKKIVTPSVSAISAEVLSKQRFAPPITTRFKDQTEQVFGDLGVLQGRISTKVLMKELTAQKRKQKKKTILSEKTILESLQRARTKVSQIQPQQQKLRQKQLQKQLQKLITPSISITSISTPSITNQVGLDIIIPFGFLRTKPSKKKKKRVSKPRETPLTYVPSFTARALGITAPLSEKQLLKGATMGALSLRPIPIS